MFIRFHSLERRIVTLFLALIFLLQLGGFMVIRNSIYSNARASIGDELVIGRRVFAQLIAQDVQKLTDGARLLAADYGFKQAIGTKDRETIESALANNKERIGASIALLVDIDRTIKASTSASDPSLAASILQLVETAEGKGSANAIGIVDNHPYQIVVVPVRAPITIGWVAMAFPIDKRLVDNMRELSSLQVSILTGGDGHWMVDESTLSAFDAAVLSGALPARIEGNERMQISVGGGESSTLAWTLAQAGGRKAVVVLQRSVSEAVARYDQLQLTLLILTGIGLLFAVLGSILTAKRIAEPLRQLATDAERLGSGDYTGRIEVNRADEVGALSKAFESMREGISKREVEIRRLAYWDTLTGLSNRAQFLDVLSQAIERAKAANGSCCVMMMDLDRFKHVNDVLGHSFGDALLRRVAERLREQIVGPDDHLARLGGDEFAVLFPDSGIDEARQTAARILRSFEIPISIEEQTIDFGAGIGIASYPAHGADAASLMSHAEVAMYAAKTGGNDAVVYDPSIDKSSQQNLSLLSELRRAVEGEQFRLYVQPKALLSTGRIVGLEVLVRWVHPERGMVFPDQFIPFAEKTGFIRSITRWVLERSAALCNELEAEGLHLRISVNLSTRDLLDSELPARFGALLEKYAVPASSFCLEITESAIMDDPVRAEQTLDKLHAMGVDLSIDDFGTGYSSLAYLKRLPVSELKIDKSFVLKMERDAGDAKIVRSTIDLGHNMGLKVVAEGIENQAVWELLERMGCDQAQGYFISKPMPVEQLANWLAGWAPPQLPATGRQVGDVVHGG